jgi:hypothetical protein
MDEQSPPMTSQSANVHKAVFDVIQFCKKQQWTITNYVVLVYAAIFGIAKGLQGIITVVERAF